MLLVAIVNIAMLTQPDGQEAKNVLYEDDVTMSY